MAKFQDFLSHNLLVDDARLLSPSEVKELCIEYDTYNTLSDEEKKLNDKHVICPKADWVALSRFDKTAHSVKGNHFFISADRAKMYSKFELHSDFTVSTLESEVLRKRELPGMRVIKAEDLLTKNKKKEGDFKMEDNKTNDVLAQINKFKESKSFSAQAPVEENKVVGVDTENPLTPRELSESEKKSEKIKQEIEDRLSRDNASQADLSEVQDYNRKHGELLGYITQNDSSIAISTTTIYEKDENGKDILRDNLSDDIRKEIESGARIKPSWKKSSLKLNPREKAPSPIKGIVLKTPEAGIFDMADVYSKAKIEIGNSSELKIQLFDKDQGIIAMLMQYGGVVKEAHSTHGTNGQSYVSLQPKYSKVKKEEDKEIPAENLTMRVDKQYRKSLICPTNYLPLKTYQTIKLSNLDAETADALNVAMFNGLFKSTDDTRKYDRLNAHAKTLVTKEDGKIVSKYFTAGGDRAELIINRYHSKEAVQVNEVPVKVGVPQKKDPTKKTYKFVSFDTLSPKVMNEEYKENCSLYSGKFETFLNACEGTINANTLKAFRASTTKGKGKQSAEERALKHREQMEKSQRVLGMLVKSGAQSGIALNGKKSFNLDSLSAALTNTLDVK